MNFYHDDSIFSLKIISLRQYDTTIFYSVYLCLLLQEKFSGARRRESRSRRPELQCDENTASADEWPHRQKQRSREEEAKRQPVQADSGCPGSAARYRQHRNGICLLRHSHSPVEGQRQQYSHRRVATVLDRYITIIVSIDNNTDAKHKI